MDATLDNAQGRGTKPNDTYFSASVLENARKLSKFRRRVTRCRQAQRMASEPSCRR